MKIITIILSTIVLNACGGTKEAAVVKQESEAKAVKENSIPVSVQDESLRIEYTAITRGAYKYLEVIDEKINVKRSHSDKGTNIDCLKDQWSKIVFLSNKVSLENLSKLEAPSKASHYDGALAATLKVTKDGKTYETSTFDHGNPPKEIKPLVDYILSLSKVE